MSQSKIFMFLGATRSGKGTINRVLKRLVNIENVIEPDLDSLAGPFGKQQLIGKRLAVFPDEQISGKIDKAPVVKTLKSISGEDGSTVPRKHKEVWSGQLRTRFLIIANMLQDLTDVSAVIAHRFIILEFTSSFLGKEDHFLTKKLCAELPGVLNWAIEGWHRLNERGHFIQPASSEAAMEEMEEIASPMRAFIKECCIIDPKLTAKRDDLYIEYKCWCDREGRDYPSTKAIFGKNLRAAMPGIKTSNPRGPDGKPYRVYKGIGLTDKGIGLTDAARYRYGDVRF